MFTVEPSFEERESWQESSLILAVAPSTSSFSEDFLCDFRVLPPTRRFVGVGLYSIDPPVMVGPDPTSEIFFLLEMF